MTVPSWWAAVLLALAAYRIYRIIGLDKITERPRFALLDGIERMFGRGEKVSEFVTCPWCAGFWICGVLLALYYWSYGNWPDVLGFAVVWLALSTVVGLIGKLDPPG